MLTKTRSYNEVQYDVTVDDGAVLYKLFLRAFPNNFDANSVYAHFPFVIPSENLKILKSLGRADQYSWERPTPVKPLIFVNSLAACKKILDNQADFKVTWGSAIEALVKQPNKQYGVDYCLAGDGAPNAASRALVMKALYPKSFEEEVKEFFTTTTKSLIDTNKFKVPGTANTYQVDIVRDVSNLVCALFSAEVFGLPIKTPESPLGIYTVQEMYQVLTITFIAIFFNVDVAKAFQVSTAAKSLAQNLGNLVKLNVEAIAATGFIADEVAKLQKSSPLAKYGVHTIQRLLESKIPMDELIWTHL